MHQSLVSADRGEMAGLINWLITFLKQTLSPYTVILFRTIKKTRKFKQTEKWPSTRENLSSGFPIMHDSIKPTCLVTAISLRMLNLYV